MFDSIFMYRGCKIQNYLFLLYFIVIFPTTENLVLEKHDCICNVNVVIMKQAWLLQLFYHTPQRCGIFSINMRVAMQTE